VRPTFEAIQSITTATPTNINGLLKGNGSTVSAATAGTDYQAALVSGTNIKTVNNTSILGSGDIDTDPVAQTWAGTNPNIPENLTITGTTPAAPASIPRSIDVEGYPSWDDLTWEVSRISGVWIIASPTLGYEAQKASDALTPVGLTDWVVGFGTGQPTLTGDNPAGDYLGQLLQASDDSWWRWNGSEWEQDVVDNASVNTAIEDDPAATRTALGGGAAGQEVFQAADYSGTGSVRKLAGLDTTDKPSFAGATLTSAMEVTGSATVGGIAGTLMNLSADGAGRIFATSGNTPYHYVRQSTGKFVRIGPLGISYGPSGTVPTSNLHIDSTPWVLDTSFAQRPGSSVTPANNGDLVFEATSNTEVTVKLKGSDGVVRSVVLALT
jgi:hypothetical protein